MRRTALALAVIVIAGFATSAPVGARTGDVRAAAANITVTPSTNLVAGQAVNVSGNGFNPDASLASAECKAGPVTTSDCDLSNTVLTTADGTGAYSFGFTVQTFLNTANGPVDCTAAAGACVLGVADTTNIAGTAVTAALDFASLGPPQAGDLQVPVAPVAAGYSVEIAGTNFAPVALIETDLCAANATDATQCDVPRPVNADGTGALNFSLVPSNTLVTQNGNSIDCTVADACVYAAWDFRDFTGTLTTAPVSLAPEVGGSLTVVPATDLHDGDQVTLSGSGWPADLPLSFTECDGTASTANCTDILSAPTDTNGAFSTPYTVNSVSRGGQYIDCETGPCWIVAHWYATDATLTAAQPIAFDVTTTPVTSHYAADELAAVTQAATKLGVTNTEEQYLGTWGLAWVLLITGAGAITPAPDSGPGTLTTDWLPSEFSAMTAFAAAHGATLAEFQKTGALFLAYVLAIS
jgi:hypothetical protein